jgi:hypothetical protein
VKPKKIEKALLYWSEYFISEELGHKKKKISVLGISASFFVVTVGGSSKGDFCASSKGDRFRASIFRGFRARCFGVSVGAGSPPRTRWVGLLPAAIVFVETL